VKENIFIKEALEEAKKALTKNEVPVGAVIVKNNKIISRAHNLVVALNDPTAHAEMLVIKDAAKKLGTPRLDDCDIYITLEPCAMCTAAISLAKIKRIFYCVNDEKFGAIESNPFFYNGSAYFRPESYSNINSEESQILLRQFFQNKR
jgi:tRNA(adenine34) deaminase